MTRYLSLILLLGLLLSLFTGCRQKQTQIVQKPELLIYCGNTMGQPIRKLGDQLEQQQNCTVKIMLSGSGQLYRSLSTNRVGDLFLPGSASYMEKANREGLISRIVTVGINQATLVVRKGNPLAISADLNNMVNPDYRTILADPHSGSIGKESKRILTRAGIYQKARDQVLTVTTDSKGLVRALAANKADLTINWRATTFWPENSPLMDALPLPEEIAPPHKLLMGLLTFSTHPELANAFMDLASGPEGKELFITYGFGH